MVQSVERDAGELDCNSPSFQMKTRALTFRLFAASLVASDVSMRSLASTALPAKSAAIEAYLGANASTLGPPLTRRTSRTATLPPPLLAETRSRSSFVEVISRTSPPSRGSSKARVVYTRRRDTREGRAREPRRRAQPGHREHSDPRRPAATRSGRWSSEAVAVKGLPAAVALVSGEPSTACAIFPTSRVVAFSHDDTRAFSASVPQGTVIAALHLRETHLSGAPRRAPVFDPGRILANV